MAGDSGPLEAGEMQELLRQVPGTGPEAATAPAASPITTPKLAADAPATSESVQNDIDYLIHQAQAALASVTDPSLDAPAGVKPFTLRDFSGSPPSRGTV